jgi:hypothetical protein
MAQGAHHIRIGTNGGSSINPSDYFCIPLTNEYHTTGLFAIHVVGEETFLKELKLKKNKLFITFLKQYLLETFNVYVQLEAKSDEALIAYMIEIIEENGPQVDAPKKIKKPKKSLKDNEFYQKAKEEKNTQNRELRAKIKKEVGAQKSSPKSSKKKSIKKTSATQSEFYQKAKELKKIRDKEFREKIKLDKKKNKARTTSESSVQSEYYQKAKELKRIRDKEFRDKLKRQRKMTTK